MWSFSNYSDFVYNSFSFFRTNLKIFWFKLFVIKFFLFSPLKIFSLKIIFEIFLSQNDKILLKWKKWLVGNRPYRILRTVARKLEYPFRWPYLVAFDEEIGNKINLYQIKLNIILYLYSPISISLSKTNRELKKLNYVEYCFKGSRQICCDWKIRQK